ncbi:MAG: GNAT family N-acetyltransferase [Deltaproteobacteria bacterium]|nr:GNAT family N-acetyltransferase [Deltaproteobacteria bacterium]MBW2047653.1 GNAT family N-acetyltransferase [Deltaproteobacteria bacterium]MBW2110680.1 GNAT family N-acetyltransferase [Deltaproteobacteria bacterium]MBW2351774.1 GNAT family N-acetyltransferase [Deltaproteobacteria bacterium]HDZ90144.1 GNAT family N-acetyltransferase [Deltaproteobacteria bacterium]
MENHIEFSGYFPGVIGRITTLHAVYYHDHWGLDRSFEAQVSRELSDFIVRFDGNRDGLWTANSEEELMGAIAIAGDRDHPNDARLRWYIVDPRFQGRGMGKALIRKAIDFAAWKGYKRIYLWTFEGLKQAQSIYEQNGFFITQDRDVEQWGCTIREQRFELVLDPHGS